MAKLILLQREQSPWNDDGDADFAYFEGTPTEGDLAKHGAGRDGFSRPERKDSKVSRRAGLERWFLTQAV
jgi:hypothetical protein